jgi:hypothetical protein
MRVMGQGHDDAFKEVMAPIGIAVVNARRDFIPALSLTPRSKICIQKGAAFMPSSMRDEPDLALVELLHEVAAEFGAAAMKEPAGLESGVGNTERLCREVRDLLAKVRSTLDRVRDISAPESMSSTMAGILEALVVKENGEDPLVATVRRQVTIGSESVFSMLMMHGVEFDADMVMSTYPKDKDGRDVASKAYLERARDLSARMASFLADRNAKRAATRARKRSASGAPSSRVAGSST